MPVILLADVERRVGVIPDVVLLQLVVAQQIVDDASKERDVAARADRRVEVAHGRRAREARVDDHELRLVVMLGLDPPLDAAGVRIGRLPPMIRTGSAFLMSTQWFVIAPRPNVGARLATVGPCQTRAWLSNTTMPSERTTFQVR